MRRAMTLIVVLLVLSLLPALWLDIRQRDTAQSYMAAYEQVRRLLLAEKPREAEDEAAYLHALWQKDETWLNCLISHHHTRAVNTALLKLSTAMAQGWQEECLQAIDEVQDALSDIAGSDLMSVENLL